MMKEQAGALRADHPAEPEDHAALVLIDDANRRGQHGEHGQGGDQHADYGVRSFLLLGNGFDDQG
ncbi:hypothetical protein [Nocardia sp. NPDC050710]|uniref:hypothetical protein n=1 Tax=Nocardia sp. NPDC050710 TaxID=3157220 RepID=UPI0033C1B3AF